jgi:hypothetical protein
MAKSSPEKNTPVASENATCMVRLDRLVFVCPRCEPDEYDEDTSVRINPPIPGFRVTGNKFVRRRAKITTYRRVRSLINPKTGTKVFVQHDRAHGFLRPVRVTVVGPDATGILWPDLQTIGDAYGDLLVRTLELAFDFAPDSGVDKEYVLKHALFGKSRPGDTGRYPDRLRYGAREADKLVRCYWKKEVNAFRVELELHSGWPGLPQTDCLLYTTGLVKKDLRFVYVRWRALDRHLASKGPRGKRIAAEARLHYRSIHELLGYLRSMGINNAHRFVRTSKKDVEIRQAFELWRNSFSPQERNRRHSEEQHED